MRSRLFITMRGQVKVDGMALFIDRSIQVGPLAFYFDIGLIHIPYPVVFLIAMFA